MSKCHVVNSVKQEPWPRLGRPSCSLRWRSTCKSFLLVICWKGDVCAQLYLFDLDSLSVFPYAAFIYLRLCDFDLSSTFQSSLFSFPSSSWFPLGFGGGVFLNNPNLAKDENCTEEHVLFFWIYVRLCNWVWMVDRACVWTILKSNIHSFFVHNKLKKKTWVHLSQRVHFTQPKDKKTQKKQKNPYTVYVNYTLIDAAPQNNTTNNKKNVNVSLYLTKYNNLYFRDCVKFVHACIFLLNSNY